MVTQQNSAPILITGGSGFLGGHLAVQAAKRKIPAIATYHAHPVSFPGVQWEKLDLDDRSQIEALLRKYRPAVILHTAALTDVDYCESHRGETEAINIGASGILAEIGAEWNARFLYVSTDLVFDGQHPPYGEEAAPNPLSFYGWSKWQGELRVQEANPNHVIVRPSIIFGPPALQGTSFSEWMRLSWLKGKTIPLFTDQYRTPISGENLAEALLELATLDYTGILHIGGSEPVTRYRFGVLLADWLGYGKKHIRPAKMSEVSLSGRRPADVSLNISLARSLLQTELLDCRRGIARAYREFRKNALQ